VLHTTTEEVSTVVPLASYLLVEGVERVLMKCLTFVGDVHPALFQQVYVSSYDKHHVAGCGSDSMVGESEQ
jgi:hypothetical protein